MSFAAARSSAGYSVPAIQNTAPVLEYRCLFSHDLKRKQKRWHDGVLRLHTFNKRIMVYDTQGGYIGDKHWKKDGSLDEGEELTLDKGALVEVCDMVTTSQTDISVLFQRKSKASPEKGDGGLAKPRSPLSTRSPIALNKVQQKHKSLHSLLGSRQGDHGRATISTESPFQKREQERENRALGDEQPSKRRRIDRPIDTLQKTKLFKNATSNLRTGSAAKLETSVPQPARHSIDITSDEIHSDITVPPTPPPHVQNTDPGVRKMKPNLKENTIAPVLPAIIRDIDTSFIASEVTVEVSEPPKTGAAPTSPPAQKSAEHTGDRTQLAPDATRKSTQSRPLRIVKAPPRRMLMCLDEQPVRKSQTDAKSDGLLGVRSAANIVAASGGHLHRTVQPAVTKPKPQRKTLLEIDDELDAMDRDESSGSLEEAVALVKPSERKLLQRTTSLTFEKKPRKLSPPYGLPVELSRRSPLKKDKSLSTTDAGNDQVAEKSGLSKAKSSGTRKTAKEPERSLKSVKIEPWSVEALDLFDWRPPDAGTGTHATAVVGVA